ncbi:MAG: hypothetical protein ACRCV0_01445 [Brevinema sp.]
MRKFNILMILLFLTSCQISNDDKYTEEIANSQLTQSTFQARKTLEFKDCMSYIATVNKPYLAVMPVKKQGDKYYLLDKDFNILPKHPVHHFQIKIDLKKMAYAWIRKRATVRIDYPGDIAYFVVFIMDPLWTSGVPGTLGLSDPTFSFASKDTAEGFIQKIEGYTYFNIMGWYKYQFINVNVRSQLVVAGK